jgi:hypothetical protein
MSGKFDPNRGVTARHVPEGSPPILGGDPKVTQGNRPGFARRNGF